MNRNDITSTFLTLVSPSHPNDWEISEIVDTLHGLPEEVCSTILNHVPSIWPISNALCYAFIHYAAQQWPNHDLKLFSEWVRQILFHYESGGLRAAQTFMNNSEKLFFSTEHGLPMVTFEDIKGALGPYIRGLAGAELSLKVGREVWTNTETIYLPSYIDIFPQKKENILLYKLLASYQWALIDLELFPIILRYQQSIQNTSTGERQKAFTIHENPFFTLYCFIKGMRHFETILPGLWLRSITLLQQQEKFFSHSADSFSQYIHTVLANICTASSGTSLTQSSTIFHNPQIQIAEALSFMQTQGHLIENFKPSVLLTMLLGTLKPLECDKVVQERQKRNQQKFIAHLAFFIHKKRQQLNSPKHAPSQSSLEGKVMKVLQDNLPTEDGLKTQRAVLQIDNKSLVLPEELQKMAETMVSENGKVPMGYVQAAVGMASGGYLTESQKLPPETMVVPPPNNSRLYDEWDCRRQGYRKDWCTVITEELPHTKNNFIADTNHKHHGLRKRLRSQFELLRTDRRIVKAQRDGDEIDIDAITESMCNHLAEQPVSTRIFTNTLRNTRDISTFFLIDMSNSTAGWIGKFIKESLLLLSEAIDQVGDQYAIYGFSGMRRSGCKIYPIKTITETYSKEVQGRISAIGPKEYTRMAPAIRHLTHLHKASTTATRLLICLSDGKPEDYDGYSGNYAIEDTRKAFLEAQGQGIIPFCITVDKQAHTYLARMCGTQNYIFINSIESLPAKVSQLYRALTS